MGTDAKTKVYANGGKTMADYMKTGLDRMKKKPYKPKPYEQMQYPGQRTQLDVKIVLRR